jgi:hypothetical protein
VTLSPRQLTLIHRRQQLALREVVKVDVARAWPLLDYSDLEKTYPALAAEVFRAVSSRRSTSTGLAIAYLRAFRVAHGLGGAVDVKRPQIGKPEFVDALRATSLAPVKNATAAGKDPASSMAAALVLTSGAMSRLVLNAGRDTVTQTVAADPHGQGFVRVVGGNGCDFCRERAGIPVTGEADVFESHGGCGCTAEPIYG